MVLGLRLQNTLDDVSYIVDVMLWLPMIARVLTNIQVQCEFVCEHLWWVSLWVCEWQWWDEAEGFFKAASWHFSAFSLCGSDSQRSINSLERSPHTITSACYALCSVSPTFRHTPVTLLLLSSVLELSASGWQRWRLLSNAADPPYFAA